MAIKNPALKIGLIILLALVLLGIFTFSIHQVLGTNVLGADFTIYWFANRAVWVEHITPYGEGVTRQIQLAIYRRPTVAGEDQVAFAYPLYTLFLTAPTALLSLDWAQALWLAFNTLTLFATVMAVFPKSLKMIVFTFPLFYPVVFYLLLGNFAAPLTVCLVSAISLLIFRQTRGTALQVFCGFLLAWVMVKPQYGWMYLAFIGLAVLKYHLWGVLVGFFGSLTVLLVASFALIPTWGSDWLAQISRYTVYLPPAPTLPLYLARLFPEPLPYILSIILIFGGLCAAGWVFFGWWKGRVGTLAVLAICGLVIYLAHPHHSYDEIPFLIPVLFWAAQQRRMTPGLIFSWGGWILFTWAIFFVDQFNILPGAVNQLALLPFLFWIVWNWPKLAAPPPANSGRELSPW